MNVTPTQPRFSGRFEMKPKPGLDATQATITRAGIITFVQQHKKHYDKVEYGQNAGDPIVVVINPAKARQEKPTVASPPPPPPVANDPNQPQSGCTAKWFKTQGRKLQGMSQRAVAKCKPLVYYAQKLMAERKLFKFVQSAPDVEVRYTSLTAEKKGS